MREEGRSYPLAKGYHKLRIEYFQRFGGIGLEFLVEAPGQQKTVVPADGCLIKISFALLGNGHNVPREEQIYTINLLLNGRNVMKSA